VSRKTVRGDIKDQYDVVGFLTDEERLGALYPALSPEEAFLSMRMPRASEA